MPRDPRSALSEWMRVAEQHREQSRRMDADLDWRSWILLRFAPYWYWAFVFFLDLGLFATILSFGGRPASALAYLAGVVFLIPAIYIEWEGYRYLWPPDEVRLARQAQENSSTPARDSPTERASSASGEREM